MSEHLRESREDLETRFLIMGNFVLKARNLTCGFEDCRTCWALREPLPIPATVRAAEQEPREDLEEAVVSINDRLETVALGPEPDHECDAYEFIHGLLTRATEKLDDA